ncbi:MAG: hypothetical protein U1F14_13735 [Steroidobacteraceae bacterium]
MSHEIPITESNPVVREVLLRWHTPDPWNYDPAELAPLQLEALKERFRERRPQLKVLNQRASDKKIEEIASFADVVPLLFSHTNYKSYPDSFVEKGRWDLMLRWMDSLSTRSTRDTDLSGVHDLDSWMRALHAAGHLAISSSGTTGRSSYLNMAPADRQMLKLSIRKMFEVACGLKAENQFPYFWAGPRQGWFGGVEHHRLVHALYARPGDEHYISDEGVTLAQLDRLASIRKAIVEGTATADVIAGAEQEAMSQAAAMDAKVVAFIDTLYARRGEPLFLFAGPSMLWRIVEAGQSRGLAPGAFHSGTIVNTGGGMKGFRGPATWEADGQRYFGLPRERWVNCYGMTELLARFFNCPAGRYHVPPSIILLMLDRTGTELLNRSEGIVEGRAGFVDLATTGRWGGIISGDRLTVDFDPCPCGRPSASIIEVARYKDLAEGDDKLSCAGQIDTYIRGFVGGDWQP